MVYKRRGCDGTVRLAFSTADETERVGGGLVYQIISVEFLAVVSRSHSVAKSNTYFPF